MRNLVLRAYIWAIRHDACPCMLAGAVSHALQAALDAALMPIAYVGGALCRRLDAMISSDDNVCALGCEGCKTKGAA